MTKTEEYIYNTFLRISRSKRNLPFKLRKDFSKFEEIVNMQRAKTKPCLGIFEKKTKKYNDSPSNIDYVSFENQAKLMECFVSGLNLLLDQSKKDTQLRDSLFSIPHINKMKKRIKTSV